MTFVGVRTKFLPETLSGIGIGLLILAVFFTPGNTVRADDEANCSIFSCFGTCYGAQGPGPVGTPCPDVECPATTACEDCVCVVVSELSGYKCGCTVLEPPL